MTPLFPPTGPLPAQIHNAFACLVGVYGPLLDQQQRTIELLQQQLAQARKTSPVAALQPGLADLQVLVAKYEEALERIATAGSLGVTIIAKEALGRPVAALQPEES